MADGKPGPKYKDIKKMDFEKLCALQCTQQEICDFFEVDHKTLTKWCKRTYRKEYSQVYAEKKTGGKISLRRMQFRLAEKSAAMAIFLGKNILGQSDFPENGDNEDVIARSNLQVETLAEQLARAMPTPDIDDLIAEAEKTEAGDGA